MNAAIERQCSRQPDWTSTMESRIRDIGSVLSSEHFCTAWMETLLHAHVHKHDSSNRAIFFCVDCHTGMFSELEFKDGGDHSGHTHFPVYFVSNALIVHTVVLMGLKLEVSDIHSVSVGSHYFNYLHSHCLHFLDADSEDLLERFCSFCTAPISGPFIDDIVKYCCLECKYFSIKDSSTSTTFKKKSLFLISEPADATSLEHSAAQDPQGHNSETSVTGASWKDVLMGRGKACCEAECESNVGHRYERGTVGFWIHSCNCQERSAAGDVLYSRGGHESGGDTSSLFSWIHSSGHHHRYPESSSDDCIWAHSRGSHDHKTSAGTSSTWLYSGRSGASNGSGPSTHSRGVHNSLSEEHSDLAFDSETEDDQMSDSDAVLPSEVPLLMEHLTQATKLFVKMDTRCGITMVVAVGMEKQTDHLQIRRQRSNDGCLRRAAELFKSYVRANRPTPLVDCFFHEGDKCELLAHVCESDHMVEENPVSDRSIAGDSEILKRLPASLEIDFDADLPKSQGDCCLNSREKITDFPHACELDQRYGDAPPPNSEMTVERDFLSWLTTSTSSHKRACKLPPPLPEYNEDFAYDYEDNSAANANADINGAIASWLAEDGLFTF